MEVEGRKACRELDLVSQMACPVSFKMMGRDFNVYHVLTSVISFISNHHSGCQELCGNLQLFCGITCASGNKGFREFFG